ncbi:MAG TPA: SulP family inorganic anion transporter [Ottowia sp.]|uniref:SulP family inorganic anion transporter n=1 Tax=Ottowia sp. TaxID=1898956 RepID=UPI002C88F013|nr:SulP family inorganic anion transporter [Ottowia sp.]HRQ03615.1 SulP family inorganic anion transporter [Ottowia sp.]
MNHTPDPTPAARATVAADAVPLASGWLRWLPGLHVLLHYQRGWLPKDLVAGLALSAMLVPVGMGYAEAAGVPAIHGLYATIIPLLVYALLGPSRVMVLGPDSTLAAVIASLILPLAGGSVERAVALAAVLALLSGGFLLLIGFARLGVMADLFSKPIRLGFFNAIALTVIISQIPKLLGFSATANGSVERVIVMAQGFMDGRGNPAALIVGLACLAIILGLRRWRPNWPGVLVAVVLATMVSAWFDLAETQGLDVIGEVPPGLPVLTLPFADVTLADLRVLAPGAAIIALLAFANTSVLSRALAARSGQRVNPDQEMLALGGANLATALMQGFPISSSNSRTPVAVAAGARTQLASIVSALVIALLLVLAPTLVKDMPQAALGAVVITACISFADWPGMFALLKQRRIEFMLAVASFLGVVFFGVIEGIAGAIALSLLVMVWNAWHPYYTVLVRVHGRKGYHDATRHPEGSRVPGLVLFRWDAQLFFANADLFREALLLAIDEAPTPIQVVIVAADAVNDIDVTAADMLAELDHELEARGIDLQFAGLKGHVRDLIMRYGLSPRFDRDHFHPTVGNAVNVYRQQYEVDWKDWDER